MIAIKQLRLAAPQPRVRAAPAQMRNAIAVVTLLLAICGCSERVGQTRLGPLARGLAEAWQTTTNDLKLTIRAVESGGPLGPHSAKNVGTSELRVIALELKTWGPGTPS